MRRVLLLSLALLFSVGLACDDDGGGGGGTTDEPTDETTDEETISLDDWIEQADEICAANDEEVAAIDQPTFDPFSADLDDAQFQEVADYLNEVIPLEEDLIDDLVALPPPDQDADQVDETITTVQNATDAWAAAAASAENGDGDAYLDALQSGQDLFEEASESAADLGLQECGQDGSDNTGTGTGTGTGGAGSTDGPAQ
jgi:hypothetical protein